MFLSISTSWPVQRNIRSLGYMLQAFELVKQGVQCWAFVIPALNILVTEQRISWSAGGRYCTLELVSCKKLVLFNSAV